MVKAGCIEVKFNKTSSELTPYQNHHCSLFKVCDFRLQVEKTGHRKVLLHQNGCSVPPCSAQGNLRIFANRKYRLMLLASAEHQVRLKDGVSRGLYNPCIN